MLTPTNQHGVLLFGLFLLLYFAFILSPWCFSHAIARATGGWLLIPAYPPFCFCSRRYVDLATAFFISSQRAFCVHLRTEEKVIVKQQSIASVSMRPPLISWIHWRGLNELRPSAIPWSVSVSGHSLREAYYLLMILVCSFLISRARLSAIWPCKCRLTFFQMCLDWLYFWGVTQKVVMLQSHFKCICNLRFCTSFPKSSTAFSKSTNLLLISSSIWVWAPQYTLRFLCMSGDSLFCTLMRLFRTQMYPVCGGMRQREKKNILILPIGINH